ncbi:MAG TPA: hypothetical protein VKX49_10375 [Bryobacteraceae bacterium]|nr:hypothetical protein [Bryobacteraceae bacterium]
MQWRLANIDPVKAPKEPTVIVFVGCIDAFDTFLEKLVTAIGPACRWASEQEFCEYTGCSPHNLEDWLSQDWVQHYPHLVLSLEDIPGPVPWVLYKVTSHEQKVRVFSAGPELAQWLGTHRDVQDFVQ